MPCWSSTRSPASAQPHLDIDGWGIDVIIGGSQKAVMIPPGLAYLGVSEKGLHSHGLDQESPLLFRPASKSVRTRRRATPPTHPSVALIAGLGAALDYMLPQGGGDLAAGRNKLIENAETCAAMTRAGVEALGLKLFAPEAPAAAVTAVLAPEGVDSGVIVKELKARFAAIITNGQGEMQGKLFASRISATSTTMDTIALVGALELVAIDTLKIPGVQFGDALTAAQKAFASRKPDEAARRECSCGRAQGHCAAVALEAATR